MSWKKPKTSSKLTYIYACSAYNVLRNMKTLETESREGDMMLIHNTLISKQLSKTQYKCHSPVDTNETTRHWQIRSHTCFSWFT